MFTAINSALVIAKAKVHGAFQRVFKSGDRPDDRGTRKEDF